MVHAIRRIMFPTDFSEPSKEAAQYAMDLAEKFDAELHLFHAVSPIISYSEMSMFATDEGYLSQQELVAAEKQLLERVLDSSWTTKHRVKYKTVLGFPVEQILAYAKENEIDLIVLGTHGYSGFAHTLIGSVAEKIVRMSDCPVLTVHRGSKQIDPFGRSSADAVQQGR